ncbi:GNAT family N-acetyltransferase [Roseateles oligotrophus]|uniref:GNAT family N-acetyltransferase n=1 Tax=Roseateles oligotrophus TaxID=1769250 RepID=A0ABT2YIB6_9BURK|nr:GNAT family N-acetyltransferase [Roseateles oligotrophus]MCV2369748.1 GNAT family N-acetyltransferase [Roseateles oligotrophus]
MSQAQANPLIRPATPADAARLAMLCAEHAEYEGLPPTSDAGLLERLAQALIDERLHIWLALEAEQLLAYASATLDFSTLSARPFLHMDCLYLRPQARGHGLGARLMQELAIFARARGCHGMQWQTPPWNAPALRFYARQGALALEKTRFSLAL